ncbi:NF038130 family PEP-CTERM protein [Calothrix sp. 336/3]|uniref:NF038130 family PEP-CTERM protein n=1 Tax=Calothrix sp. 336/3 TaxID=1337936 RepID=UPI0004E3E5DA|nr:NF038130 family PEP-CTERM protein [Calothrix sp. 336/3]AKG20295.1 hypothetical protein IJ00_02280 [Calothrix sp. 336/3]
MKKITKTLLIGASLAAGMSAIAPAQAGTLTNVTIGGTNASDYYVYDADTTSTFRVQNPTAADIQKVLSGDKNSPTGNIELAASSEQTGFDFAKNTTLTGNIGGQALTLSSLTSSDWTSNYKNTGKTLGRHWFDSALTANGFGSLVSTAAGTGFFNAFQNNGGFQRFSDPNISYVNQDDSTGLISIGLAGHLNATSLLLPYFDLYVNSLSGPQKLLAQGLRGQLANSTIRASEIVKYTYNGTTDYLFGFSATDSKLVNNKGIGADNISHNGNYEVSFQGIVPPRETPKATPEPSVMLGMLAVGGVFAAQRKLKKAAQA